ncbi:MAG: WG repeat-containing protein [Clostridia bacterium]|nr:WG repeat-containing protein [Clostridia bacterium]
MKKLSAIILIISMLLPLGVNGAGEMAYDYILKPEFERIERSYWYDTYYTATDKNGKVALYGSDGYKITGDYDTLRFYDDFGIAMILAQKDGVYYVLNNQGKVTSSFNKRVIGIDSSYVYVDLSGTTDDRPLSYYEGDFGVYTYNGTEIAVLSYDRYMPPKNSGFGITMSCGRMIFFENGKCGAVDSDFNVVIEPVYDSLQPFGGHILAVASRGGKYGLIDGDGNVVTDFVYDYITPQEDEQGRIRYRTMLGDNFGFLSQDGKPLIEPAEGITPDNIYYDYSLIRFYVQSEREDKDEYPQLYGLMDFEGNIILPAEHTSITHISEGRITATKSYGHGGYYDLFGNEITEFKYSMCSPYSEGLAFASSCIDGVWTHEVLDMQGEVVFNPPNWASGFFGGIAYSDKKFIDTRGNVVGENNEWKEVEFSHWWNPYRDGTFTVNTDSGKGIVKLKKQPQEAKWDWEYIDNGNMKSISKAENGYVITNNDGTEAYVDINGKFTDNAVEVTGRNVFNVDGVYELRDDSNNVIMNFPDNAWQFGNYICTLSNEENVNDRSFAIFAKDGTRLFEGSCGEYRDTGTGWKYIDENGYFVYCNAAGFYGISDVYGNNIVRPEYEYILAYDGKYALKKDGGWTVIDKDENVILDGIFNYDRLYKWNNIPEYIIAEHEGKTKILNENYELVLDLGNKYLREIPCKEAVILNGEADRSQVLMNINGEVIVPEAQQYFEYLGEGIFSISGHTLVNLEGKVLASELYYITDMGDNGLIGISRKGFEGYINTKGEAVIVLEGGYQVQGAFSEGLASVVTDNVYSRYGDTSYVDEQGKLALKGADRWCRGGSFRNGIAIVGVNLGKAGPTASMLVKCTYDTPSDWAAETVDEAIDAGLLPEHLQNRYKKNITRESFCEIAYELPVIKNAAIQGEQLAFTDTDNEKVKILSSLGIIQGTGDGKFSPDSYITREEAATILARIYAFSGKTADAKFDKFTDDDEISDWARESVYTTKAAGIMNGVGDNRFAPKDGYTTEQAVATIVRLG